MLNIGKERERKRDGKAITKEEIECVYKRRIFFKLCLYRISRFSTNGRRMRVSEIIIIINNNLIIIISS